MKPSRSNELDERILQIIQRQTGTGCPVAAHDIKDIAWANGRGLTHDQVDRVLGRLLKAGRLRKPSRGNYLLNETDASGKVLR